MAPLSETNKYLKDPMAREIMILEDVCASSAIDGASPCALRPLKDRLNFLRDKKASEKAVGG